MDPNTFPLDRPTKPVLDYQVIVMAAGPGSRMYPLTLNRPKALLPIANRPMLWYCLDNLHRSGYDDIIVVARTSHTTLFNQFKDENPRLKMDLYFLDEEDVGTADVLRLLKEKDRIKTDFIVVSADLVTDLPLHLITDRHAIKNAAVTALVYERKADDGKKSKGDSELKELIGLDPSRTQLIALTAAADITDDHFRLRSSLLLTQPVVDIYTNLSSAHLYVFKHWVLRLIADRKAISTVQGELVPFLVKAQHRNSSTASQPVSRDEMTNREVFGELIPPTPYATATSLSSTAHEAPRMRCCAYYQGEGYCARANTLSAYADINRQLAVHREMVCQQICRGASPIYTPTDRISKSAEVHKETQVGADSTVGDGTRIDERASIKRSIIGRNCVIGRNVKLTNALLMDRVIIEEGCKLENVIISAQVTIGQDSSLKDCEIGHAVFIEKNMGSLEFDDTSFFSQQPSKAKKWAERAPWLPGDFSLGAK